MKKNDVSVTISAVDKTAAAFKSAEKNMDRLVAGAKRVGVAFAGVFGLRELGQFLRGSVTMAAEADSSLGQSLENLTKHFEDAQIAIGQAVLGNEGIKATLADTADALKIFAAAIRDPIGTIGDLFKDLWSRFKQDTGREAMAFGRWLGIPGLEAWGTKVAGAPLSNHTGARIGAGRPPVGRRSAGRSGGRGEIYSGIAGDLLTGSSVRLPFVDRLLVELANARPAMLQALVPTGDEIADQLDQALGDARTGIGLVMKDMAFWEDLRMNFAQSLAQSVTQGFTQGIEMAIATGSVGDGFKALTGTMLKGLGDAMVAFGTASLFTAKLMNAIKNSLASFLPGGAITASLAMIAGGAVLGGVAQRIFGSMGSTQAFGGAISGRGSMGSMPDMGAQGQLTVILPREAYVKADDPKFQAFIAEVIARGAGRNITFRPA